MHIAGLPFPSFGYAIAWARDAYKFRALSVGSICGEEKCH